VVENRYIMHKQNEKKYTEIAAVKYISEVIEKRKSSHMGGFGLEVSLYLPGKKNVFFHPQTSCCCFNCIAFENRVLFSDPKGDN